MGRQPEALLQRRQRQPLPLVGLLQPDQHWLVAGHSAADIQRLDHQPSGSIAITAIAQLLPQLVAVVLTSWPIGNT
jgi:hypothetical protein